jgi:hypothetical protein
MKLLLILTVRRIGEAFREPGAAVLRMRKRRPIPVKGEALRERFGAVFGCDLTWTTYFRGFSRSKGECFRGQDSGWVPGARVGWVPLVQIGRA